MQCHKEFFVLWEVAKLGKLCSHGSKTNGLAQWSAVCTGIVRVFLFPPTTIALFVQSASIATTKYSEKVVKIYSIVPWWLVGTFSEPVHPKLLLLSTSTRNSLKSVISQGFQSKILFRNWNSSKNDLEVILRDELCYQESGLSWLRYHK